jgi:hypothetical protein
MKPFLVVGMMGAVVGAVLLVGFAIAMFMWLTQPGPGRTGRDGNWRRQTLFAYISIVFMTGLLQLLRLPVLVVHRFKYGGRVSCFANVGSEGTHREGNITKTCDAAITERYKLAKIGAAATSVDVCTAADVPLGVITDEVATIGDIVNVALLGAIRGTIKMVASGAIAQGALLEPAASGRVATLAVTTGTHYVVGRALDAASNAGDVIEVVPLFHKIVTP